jgi:hypothetical protein
MNFVDITYWTSELAIMEPTLPDIELLLDQTHASALITRMKTWPDILFACLCLQQPTVPLCETVRFGFTSPIFISYS